MQQPQVDRPLGDGRQRHGEHPPRTMQHGRGRQAEGRPDGVKDQRCRAAGQPDHGRGEDPPVNGHLADPQLGEEHPQHRRQQGQQRREQDRDRQFPHAEDVAGHPGVLACPAGQFDGGRAAQQQPAEQQQLAGRDGAGQAGEDDGGQVPGHDRAEVGDQPARMIPDRPAGHGPHALTHTLAGAGVHRLLLNGQVGVLAPASTVARRKSTAPHCHRTCAPSVKSPPTAWPVPGQLVVTERISGCRLQAHSFPCSHIAIFPSQPHISHATVKAVACFGRRPRRKEAPCAATTGRSRPAPAHPASPEGGTMRGHDWTK